MVRKRQSTLGTSFTCMTLGFDHPSSGEYLEFETPLPADYEQLLNDLRNRH